MADTAWIAFLPTEGRFSKDDLPHMTLIYGGETSKLPETAFNEMAKDAITAARHMGSFSLQVVGVEQLGPDDDKVDVLALYPSPQLLVARRMVERWDAGNFPDYKPHVTIGPVGTAFDLFDDGFGEPKRPLPLSLFFNKMVIAWGDKRLFFNTENY